MTKKEFRQSLPLLGYDASDTAAIDAIFDELDADGSGSLVQSELFAKLRQGLSVEIAAELRAGAVEFETEAKNRVALRSWAPNPCMHESNLQHATNTINSSNQSIPRCARHVALQPWCPLRRLSRGRERGRS